VHPQKRAPAWIVLLGGAAVLASYAYGLGVAPATDAGLWGGVPLALLPAYVTSMALATGGYFALTFFLFFHTDPDRARIVGRFDYGLFPALYVMILGPSSLWLPLASAMVEQPSSILWLGIRLVPAVVGLSSVALLLALPGLRPRRPARAYWPAGAVGVAFCIP
jgi:hypothetical protein